MRQVSGTSVALSGAAASVATVTAPKVSGNSLVVLGFEVTVTDERGATGRDTVLVTADR